MVTALDALNNWLQVDLTKLTSEAMEKNKEAIVDLNREQLEEGVKSDGSSITPAYSPFTINDKMKKNQPYDRVTLKDTGSFHRNMKLAVTRNKFAIGSTDSKTPDLTNRYSPLIFGLTTSGYKEAWVICKPDVVQGIRNITGAR